MPREGKGSRSGRKGNAAAKNRAATIKTEDEVESIASEMTETTIDSDSENEMDVEDGGETITESEKFINFLKSAIELAQEKRQNTRLKGLNDLKKILEKRCAEGDELDNLIVTLCDIIERSIKKGTCAAEKIVAAKLASLLMINSLNCTDGLCDTVFETLQPTLLFNAKDSTVSAPIREEVCRSVAVLGYYGSIEDTDLLSAINTLHNVFAKSLPKGNGELPSLSPAQILMHSAALQGFLLLLTCDNVLGEVVMRAPSILAEMLSVLETKEVEMRLEVGLGVALIYELVKDNSKFTYRRKNELIAIIGELATESHKHMAKKDRLKQKSLFRAVETYLSEEYFESETVVIKKKLGKLMIYIDDWKTKFRYDSLVHVLGTGLNAHFRSNEFLQWNFTVEELDQANNTDGGRMKKKALSEADKYRNVQRNRARDVRANQTEIYDE